MTKETILRKAIEKAVKNGYEAHDWVIYNVIKHPGNSDEQYCPFLDFTSVETIIFSHDFAKAFWGEKIGYSSDTEISVKREGWRVHLQEMVLEKNPISYLKKFL